MRRLLVLVAALITVLGLGNQVAAAGPPSHRTPDLVALGDSFAAGTGNTPYSDPACGRSAANAYSEVLDRLKLVTLQAFPACGGATTTQVIQQGQIDKITEDTDVVTVQALGNDFYFGLLVAYCLDAVPGIPDVTCHRDQVLAPLGGITVQQLLDSIAGRAPIALDTLYDTIAARIDAVHARARVVVVDYGNPFPDPSGRVGPFCPYMDSEELGVATDFANSLNVALKQASNRPNFTFANAAPRFRGLDVCGFAPAFYRVGLPGLSLPSVLPNGDPGLFHPNRIGQGIYAAVLAGRLY
jgi:lysophospholipase L1-like esterase